MSDKEEDVNCSWRAWWGPREAVAVVISPVLAPTAAEAAAWILRKSKRQVKLPMKKDRRGLRRSRGTVLGEAGVDLPAHRNRLKSALV